MKKIHTAAALLLLAALLLSLSACGGEPVTGLRTLASLGEANFRVAFRTGDRLGEDLTAALQVLAARGELGALSVRWFGEDLSLLEGDAGALAARGEIPRRSLLVGVLAGSAPMAFRSAGQYTGFDVELARAACELLGWDIQFLSVEAGQVALALAAGNVDCVWSGMSFENQGGVDCSPAYLKNELLLVTAADSGLKKVKKLSGKVLGMTGDEEHVAAWEKSDYAALPGEVRSFGNAESCFNALKNHMADVILTDSTALAYYG